MESHKKEKKSASAGIAKQMQDAPKSVPKAKAVVPTKKEESSSVLSSISNLFGSKKITTEAKAATPIAAPNARLRGLDQKSPQVKKIDLASIKITPQEIKNALNQFKEGEEKSFTSKIKGLFASSSAKAAAQDDKSPASLLDRYESSFDSKAKNLLIKGDELWKLIALAMDPRIKESSHEHQLFEVVIGASLSRPAQHEGILVKLRSWNNFYNITQANFSQFCKYCIQGFKMSSPSEIAELYHLPRRQKPLVVSLLDRMRDTASEISNDVSGALNDAHREVAGAVTPKLL